MSFKLSKASPYRVGVAAIAALGLMGLLIVYLSTASFGTKDYTAQLEHTAGLRVGESVQVAGVHSGEITSVELDGEHVKVEFNLDSEIDLGEDTTAAVRVATLLGTHYLAVEPKGSGAVENIGLERTTVPYNLQDVLEGGNQALKELDPKLLAKTLSTLGDTLEAGGRDLGPALEGISRVSEVVSTRVNQADKLLVAARNVSDQLAQSTDDIVGLMRQSQLVLDEIVRRRDAIEDLLVDANRMLNALNEITATADKHVGAALKDLDVTLTMLKDHRKDLTESIRLLAPTARYVANAGGNGPWLDVYIPSAIPDAG